MNNSIAPLKIHFQHSHILFVFERGEKRLFEYFCQLSVFPAFFSACSKFNLAEFFRRKYMKKKSSKTRHTRKRQKGHKFQVDIKESFGREMREF